MDSENGKKQTNALVTPQNTLATTENILVML